MRFWVMVALGLFGAAIFMSLDSQDMTVSAQMADKLPQGLTVGQKVPDDFVVFDTDGSAVTLSRIARQKGVVLLFVRSLDWCPYCIGQAKDWSAAAPQFKALGYGVATISYDTPETIAKFTEQYALQISTLSDKDSAMIKKFGLLNETMQKGTRYYGIPHPAVYVVDPSGTITHRFSKEGYKQRPVVDEVLVELGGEPLPNTKVK